MSKDLLDLYNINILDRNDINKIRSYVNKEFAFASKKDKLTIFSSEFNKMLDKSLDGLCYSLKLKVKNKLLYEFVNGHANRISLGKALDEILGLASSEELTSLENWFQRSTELNLDEACIQNALREKMIKLNLNTVSSKDLGIDMDNTGTKPFDLSNSSFDRLADMPKNLLSSSIRTDSKFKYLNPRVLIILVIVFITLTFAYNIVRKSTYSDYELDFHTLSSIMNIDKNDHMKIISDIIEDDYIMESYGIPRYFEYRDIDSSRLITYLNSRNSLLVEKDRYKTIIEISKENNLNPLLLFAIIGQEQGFVDKENIHSSKIINNPFNVYNSWESYNTSLEDSTQIAASTILIRLKNRPKGTDPFLWINATYAEDERWWVGVKSLYYLLEDKIDQ